MSKKNRSAAIWELVHPVMNMERWVEAIKLLKSEFSIVKNDWNLSWNLAWCYFKLNRLDQARTHMIRATKLAPDNFICRFGLGAVYLQRKQYRKAVANCAESLRLKDSHVARINLALAYMKQGKLTEAEKVHLEGIKLKPKSNRRYDSYACFLSDVGREEEAQRMYRKAKKLRQRN